MSVSQELLNFIYVYWKWVFPLFGVAYLVSNRFQKGLHRIPGPWLNSFSTLPRMWSVYKGKHHLEDLELHARYGKVVRVAPNLVLVSDTSEINQIYGINTQFIKSRFYDLSAVYDNEGLVPDTFVLRQNKALHSRMKRNAANAYSVNGLMQFEPWIDPVVTKLISIFDRYAASGTAFDMGDMLKRFAMDAVCSLTFGSDFNYLEKGDEMKFLKSMSLFTAYMSIFGHVAWLHPILLGNPYIARIVSGGDSSNDAMLEISSHELGKFRESPPAEGDAMTFLSRLALNQSTNPKLITDREILTHAFGNISAGSDTTAIAMGSVIYHLLVNRAAYNRLSDEIRGQLSLPVGFQEANALPYLKAVVQEAMRMHPSVGQVLGRIVPPAGATVGGYKIGAGAEVGMSPWVLHRDPEVFPDPDSFKPERWILGEGVRDEEHLRQMNRSFFSFGHGTHTCTGKHISLMEVTKLIPTLLLRYDLELAEVGQTLKFNNWWFTQHHDLRAKITRR
ncbi:unnamed protein product [Clonostachys byssicola]|uniref:Cytochrome P450 n=1 Tax=Clonostachys byssicola TaxID=160290 RepID=A0A9N9YCM2_9HYPO|nr:unnamed protein product [Clonostachys byssicola]